MTHEEIVKEFWKLHADGGVTPSTPDNPPEGWEEWRSEPSGVAEWLKQTLTTYRAQVLEEVEKVIDSIEIKEQGSVDYVHSQELKEKLAKLHLTN